MTKSSGMTGGGTLAMIGLLGIRACGDSPGGEKEREGGESIGFDFSPLSGSTSTGTSNLLRISLEAVFLLNVDIMLLVSEESNSSLSSFKSGKELNWPAKLPSPTT